MPAESDESESAEEVGWERYEYRNFTHSGTQVKRKLVLVKKTTKIGELYQHLSRNARKPVFGVSDQVRHKPACTVTEAG